MWVMVTATHITIITTVVTNRIFTVSVYKESWVFKALFFV